MKGFKFIIGWLLPSMMIGGTLFLCLLGSGEDRNLLVTSFTFLVGFVFWSIVLGMWKFLQGKMRKMT